MSKASEWSEEHGTAEDRIKRAAAARPAWRAAADVRVNAGVNNHGEMMLSVMGSTGHLKADDALHLARWILDTFSEPQATVTP